MDTKKSTPHLILIIAVSIITGVVIGISYTKDKIETNAIGGASSVKLDALLHTIQTDYVDTVHLADIVEKAIPQILGELDPHSIYIPARDLEAVASELEGSFSGVGIQFTIQEDTINVNAVVAGGPSEKVGLMAGDRVVTVNDSLFAGIGLTNDKVMRALKGPKGSHVKLGIKRATERELLSFDIVRGDIPQNTVDAAYLTDDGYGYVQISKFGRTTHAELLSAIARFNHKGCKGIIIDLRDNTGGYMEAAVRMVNEFLPEGELIVYAQGVHYPRTDEYANGGGSCQDMPLVVLTDEGSASASEIFAGAIQDNDRGMIVGRRSFGKGLVQQPFEFGDGSGMRLTIARYYTPSGRCIQRPYTSGQDYQYEMDLITRYQHGEYFSRDSIKLDESVRYSTRLLGRPVYGGGGIMPDVFVPQDTTGVSSYWMEVLNKGLLLQFAFRYSDNNRARLGKYDSQEKLTAYLQGEGIVEQFVRFASSKGVKRRNILIHRSYKILENNLCTNIIYNILGREEAVRYSNQNDNTVQEALKLLRNGEAYPTKEDEAQS
ncbi:MAG: S41 family peptidase [Prevotellaceae bacterium]|jgi:carboxyl-terminal processing protease|nr:S41 family peptidase [Prevotellaceae bacterium]